MCMSDGVMTGIASVSPLNARGYLECFAVARRGTAPANCPQASLGPAPLAGQTARGRGLLLRNQDKLHYLSDGYVTSR